MQKFKLNWQLLVEQKIYCSPYMTFFHILHIIGLYETNYNQSLYFSCRSLCGRSLAQIQMKGCLGAQRSALLRTSASQNVSLKVVPAPADDGKTYEEKNAGLKREMSPHLTIYKFQLTSVLSITHRITGEQCTHT